MSTPERPDAPALTRKQLREIRNTGATPVVTADAAAPDAPADRTSSADQPETSEPAVAESAPTAAAAPLPRAATPPAVADAPASDASVDLGVSPLTRRQARQQERIRTASVPVITPDIASAHRPPAVIDTVPEARPAPTEAPDAGETPVDGRADGDRTAQADVSDEKIAADASSERERAVVSPQLGADLLAGEPIGAALPPSFDQLISRSVTGSITTGNALILSQTPSAPPLSAPVTATGEVLITGTFNLPEGLGSTGHALGTADGKEVDAVLVDGELPAHSSPTPIAASAAISTVKTPGDLITPPTPEKGDRLMLTLAITIGVLGLALVGVLILAFVTGAFG